MNDRITRWEWHGSGTVLVLLSITVLLIPVAVVYFLTHLLKIEEDVADATNLSDFLTSRK